MAPITAIEEAKAASKRKRELDDRGRRKRLKQVENGLDGSPRPGRSDLASEPATPMADGYANTLTPSRQDKKKARKIARELLAAQVESQSVWKVSTPMGGRMLDVDPILSEDEKHLILAYNTSIQVYSTAESLLIRKISLPIAREASPPEDIVAIRLSPTSSRFIWVATSTGRIWKINWTSGAGSKTALRLKCDVLCDLAVESIRIGLTNRDVHLVSLLSDGAWHILACDIEDLSLKATNVLMSRKEMIQNLRGIKDGKAFAASSGQDLLFGTMVSASCSSFEDLDYEIFVLDCADEITCLDIRCAERIHLTKRSQLEAGDEAVLDIAVGCARGSIYYYNDLLPALHFLEKNKSTKYSLQPRKFHWHRKAVHALKWSQDGNYLISGGSECVLVLWQLDTGKKDVLPHLTAAIENIVVSRKGASYVVHLDDNSSMVLSTAEMKPTTYVSGIQTLVTPPPPSKDSLVKRINQPRYGKSILNIPTATNPLDPTRLLVSVGNGQQIRHSQDSASMPLLQTVDLSTVQGVSKQAIARTHPTDINVTSKGHLLTEPMVTHLAYSHDGTWLATVDEWQPPERDVDVLTPSSSERREVHLKFWSTAAEDRTLELVSRINGPHDTHKSESILGLAADPSSHRFATVGQDGVVRLWQPGIRQRDGIVVQSRKGQKMQSWTCTNTVYLHEDNALVDLELAPTKANGDRSGSIAFSQDGSMLVCAFQSGQDSAVYIVDTQSGHVVDALDDLIVGTVYGIGVLSSQIIVLSQEIAVYDIVLDEMRYGMHMNQDIALSQLALDRCSERFAVATTRRNNKGALRSEVAVFDPEQHEPEKILDFVHPVVSITSSVNSSGFLILDSAAQVWSITQGTDMDSVSLAQPLADIDLDKEEMVEEEDVRQEDADLNEDQDAASDDEMDLDGPEAEDDDDDTHAVVVAPQKLAEIFDTAPPFAMPPIEDMFYQVTKLFSTKLKVNEAT